MSNANCLEGIRCPDCGNKDRLFITVLIRADVTDDGADVAVGSDFYWDDDSFAICPECDRDGPLVKFRAGVAPVPCPGTIDAGAKETLEPARES